MKKYLVRNKIFIGFIAVLLSIPLIAYGQTSQDKINDILKLDEEPTGVVFEIVTGQQHGLEWALPLVKKHIDTLRTRFPKLDVAIVTHGREQFALQKQQQKGEKKVHSLSQQLVKEGVPIHICETHAQWRDVTAEDFPEYVNVAAAGPAQINDYVAVGYILIIINKPEN
jgi:intracellular sulfur oxidation DsrE/DsrF family protein